MTQHRISLARAIYADSDIILMDNPIKRLDKPTKTFLLNETINGSLKEKTRVLVTDDLSFIKSAD